MRLALMAERRPLCLTCIKIKNLPEQYLAKKGETCYMCCSRTFNDDLGEDDEVKG